MHISPVDKFFAYRLLYCYQIDTSPLLYMNLHLQKNGFSIDKGLQCHCKREQ